MPDSSDSPKCIYEAKNPSHKLCCCTRKCSGNACIMWNNLTYASFSCERRQAVRFTPCPRWPAMESSQIARLPLCCINNSISQGAWTALSQLCSQVEMLTNLKIYIYINQEESSLNDQQHNQGLLWNISPVCQLLPWRMCADMHGTA